MPISGDYTFVEKADSLVVRIPLKGCAPSKVDIFVTTSTLKVNFSPYLVDLVLKGSIDAVRHKATVKEGSLHVTLLKAEPGKTWGSLLSEVTDKHELAAARQSAMAGHKQLQESLKVSRHDRRVDDEKHALRKQMSLEETERNLLENLKQEEKTDAEERVYKEFADMEKKNAEAAATKAGKGNKNQIPSATATSKKPTISPNVKLLNEGNRAVNDIFRATDLTDMDAYLAGDTIDDESEQETGESNRYSEDIVDIDTDVDDDEEEEEMGSARQAVEQSVEPLDDNDEDIKFLPPPRSAGYSDATRVEIQYTPRVFPTPMRESKAGEEEDWVAKNRQHLKKNAVLNKGVGKGKGVDVSESDPNWLKGKGDDFFRTGDFKSAINAYSAALDADENMTSCHSNRSACYMKLALYSECIHDCKMAIEQILNDPALTKKRADGSSSTADYMSIAFSNPESGSISQLANQLNKLHVRRGTAECMRGRYSEAISDFSLVLQVVESVAAEKVGTGAFTVTGVKKDLEQLLTLSKTEAMKKEADKTLGEGEVQEALKIYSEALSLLPVHVGCLSNRSAAKMAASDVQGCVDDCTAALALLQLDPNHALQDNSGINMLVSILPPVGSEKRITWVVKTVVRRGAANAQLGNLDAAVSDYTLAASLEPKNEKLKTDLNNIRNFRSGIKKPKKSEVMNL